MLFASAFTSGSTGERPEVFKRSSAVDLKTGTTLHFL